MPACMRVRVVGMCARVRIYVKTAFIKSLVQQSEDVQIVNHKTKFKAGRGLGCVYYNHFPNLDHNLNRNPNVNLTLTPIIILNLPQP